MPNSTSFWIEHDSGPELVGHPAGITMKGGKRILDWQSAVTTIIAKGNIAEVKQGKNGIVVFEVKKQLKSVPD